MKTLIGNSSTSPTNVYNDGYLVVEHENYLAVCGQKRIKLSLSQFFVLSKLVQKAGRVVPGEEIWRYVWGLKKPYRAVSLHVYIYYLRQKLKPFGLKIETQTGVGYRFIPHH